MLSWSSQPLGVSILDRSWLLLVVGGSEQGLEWGKGLARRPLWESDESYRKWTHMLKYVYNFRGFVLSLNFRLRTLTSVIAKHREAPKSLSPVLGPGGHLYSILVKAMIICTHNSLRWAGWMTSLILVSLLFRETKLLLVMWTSSINERIQTMVCVHTCVCVLTCQHKCVGRGIKIKNHSSHLSDNNEIW